MCGWGSWADQMRPPWVWARQVGPPMVDASLRGLSLLLDTGPRQVGSPLAREAAVGVLSATLPGPRAGHWRHWPWEGGRARQG